MIARLTGTVVEISTEGLVVDCAGVGYAVSAPLSLSAAVAVGEPLTLVVRQIFREDDVTLYGFANADQRQLFDFLRDVKGCGPKISLAVLSTLGETSAARAIAEGDTRTLTQVPGVGPRLAERIALELKTKVSDLSLSSRAVPATAVVTERNGTGDEIVDALMTLGYKRQEAEAAAAQAREEHEDETQQLRAALRSLRR
ncbi:MAG: Holliday junction branch migration protein RuvA [Fimbriimonadaceae bacterium]|nr:Holliday junction branch migration protein RuvA [Fimbriimonadaceae bacterium]QYK56855.1 MAG: Holliday junction branch migration protein RuvA [Fimbriimonadaceae bacterium]